MGERQFTLDVYRGIKATTRAWLVRAFGHGFQKVAAGYSRATQQSISGYCDRNELGEGFIAVDVLIDLVKATGSTELLQLLADVCGYRVVPRHPRAATGEPLGRIAGAAMKETADVFARYGQMLEDGVLSKIEGHMLRREIHEAIEKLSLMDMQVELDLLGSAE
jgi:hypothetical protein